MSRYSIDAATSIRVWKKWGSYAPGEIEKDPYCLCARDVGISFEKADEIAVSLGFARDSLQRLCGGILHVLRHNTGNGHCCLPYEKLVKVAARMLEVEAERLELQADEVESVRGMDLERACQAAKTQADGFCLQEGELLLLKNWLSEHTERSGRTSAPEAD